MSGFPDLSRLSTTHHIAAPQPFPATRAWFWVWALLLGWLAATPGYSLDPSRALHQYRCTNWSRQNGLTVSSINAVVQSRDGYLWLGTQQGLVRFDGHAFTMFPVPHTTMFLSQNISTLSAAKRGGVWFGLREGAVGYFDGATFSSISAPWEEPNMQVFSVREAADESLWVAWNFGYGCWRPDGAAVPPGESAVGTVCYRTVYPDPTGRVWVGAGDRGTVFYFGQGERHVLPDPEISSLNVFAIACDPSGQIWIGTQLGLRRYSPQLQRRSLSGYNSYAQVNALLVDRHGILWIGTEGDGLIRYARGRFTRFTTANGLVNNYVNALCEDGEGSLWVGTRGGLSQLSDTKFTVYDAQDGLAGEPLGLATGRQGDIWVATPKGLSRMDSVSGVISNLGPEAGFTNIYLKRVWAAKDGTIYAIDGDRGLVQLRDGKVVGRIRRSEWPVAMADDEHGIVASFAGEICRVGQDDVTPFTYKSGKPPPLVWAVNLCRARDGAWWIASHRGVWKIQDGKYQQWSVQNGLSGTVANYVFEDADGTIWAGLASGIARFRHDEVRCVSTANGLFDNYIYAIVPDTFGWFWIDSSAGIFRVRRADLEDVADGRKAHLDCEAFNGPDAVKSNDKHEQEPTCAQTPDGRIWFATAGGIVSVDPAHVPSNPVPPPVYIEDVRVNGRSVSVAHPEVQRPGGGDLEFRYTALSFVAPDRIRFRYQLSGYDNHWIDAADRRSAFYTNLKPGHYTFRVQACNADHVWNETGASVIIELPPRFYETRWFVGLLLFTGGAGLLGLYAWRVGSLRRRQRRLQETNQMLDTKVRSRTVELARTNEQLKAANQQLAAANQQLTDEIAERQRVANEVERINRQLLVASREAGMAEVATSVLHNVGNVLNSVNVSVSILGRYLHDARFEALTRVGRLLADNASLLQDEKTRKIPAYLDSVARHLGEQHTGMANELDSLRRNVDHIKDIVQRQQSYSRLKATTESVKLDELFDDAVRLSGAGLSHRQLTIVREIEALAIVTDKAKVLQIIVNLLRNAIHACADAGRPGRIVIRAGRIDADHLRFEVCDDGIGIAPENLRRLFTQGFTTRKDGHGYGLHSSALAAKALGGTLAATSNGVGLGATFTLDLPLDQPLEAQPDEAAVAT